MGEITKIGEQQGLAIIVVEALDERLQAASELRASLIQFIVVAAVFNELVVLEPFRGDGLLVTALAIVVGDGVACHLIGECVEPIALAELRQATVEPQEDLLDQVLVNRWV